MAFDIDVLIVFANQDNNSGWVTSFRSFLESVLEPGLGRKPKIILKSDDDTITSPRLDNAAMLVAILTKDFVQSDGCKEYLEKFERATHATSGILNRVFKVFKNQVRPNDQPSGIRDLFGYELFELDPDSGEPREFTEYFTHDAERQYWMEIVDLSYDIFETFHYLSEEKTLVDIRKLHGGKTIYLAQTSHELTVQRNIIHKELQRMGYTVLPSRSLPGMISEFDKVVNADLAASSISIHLIGAQYGDMPEGTDRSTQEVQYRLASDRSITARARGEEFPRLIWITPEATHSGERQRKFIEWLRRDVETAEGAEILQTQLEDFKNVIREELEEAKDKRAIDDTNGRTIYLMHDQIDNNAVKPYMDIIVKAGFDLLMPEFEGELIELRQKHIEKLRRLDGAIIFQGKVNDQWVRMKALDLLKAPGFGRKKPIVGKALVSGHALANKEPFSRQNLRVIDGDQNESIESLKSFLREFNS